MSPAPCRVAAPFALLALPLLVCCSTGCSTSDDHPAALGDCVGEGCTTPIGPGTGSGGSGADADSDSASDADAAPDAPTTALSGNIVLLADDQFIFPTDLLGAGYLRVPTSSGDQDVAFTAAGYSADNVLVGPGWFSVFPDDSVADAGLSVYSTWSLMTVPANGSNAFDVPALSRTTLATIYGLLDTPTTPRSDAAQVVLVFESAGQRVPGVSLSSWPSCEAVAFDLGVGYSTSATATSSNGVAILVNTQGTSKLSWQAAGGATGSLSLIHLPGQATLVRVEVP